VLRLAEPLSFWGGVDPVTGTLIDPRSPHHGRRIAGTVLMVPETRGSSSSSAVMLELLANGQAPAALLLGRIDAILGLGILVAREMGWRTVPLLLLPASAQADFADGEPVTVAENGTIERL
jgi:predicted aconitase with swiveling domain